MPVPIRFDVEGPAGWLALLASYLLDTYSARKLGLVGAFALSAAGGALPLAEGLLWGGEGALWMPRMAVLLALAALGCACLAAADESNEPEVRPLRSGPLLSRDMAAPAAAMTVKLGSVQR